ncbi:MAG: hypothetical protein JSW12_08615 [Deltaproteobacteria bacterium]|nr:MAG: hypothetical protein JSW12_08615 [Deltaproteobacteria bacterium]
MTQNKITALKDTIDEYVQSGSHISIGGFTSNRVPMMTALKLTYAL